MSGQNSSSEKVKLPGQSIEILVQSAGDSHLNVALTHSLKKTYRGSYMSAHVLLNLLNKFGEKR